MSSSRPRTSVKLDAKSLAELMRKMQNRSEAQRNIAREPTWAEPLPREVGVQLTYRCNLRCVHCYQWNEAGLFQPFAPEQQRDELPLPVLERVLTQTAEARSKLYVWGGEPLLHSQFDEAAALIARFGRAVNLCTNGLLIEPHLEALRALGPGLVLFVSVDGLEPQHDAMRGRGTFAKVARQLEAVLAEKRAGRFAGEVSLSCMVADATIGHLAEIAAWAERLGVNSLYFQYPWFIGPETARAMDAVWADRLSWLGPLVNGAGSWHSYTHAISPGLVPALQEEVAALAGRTFGIRVLFQPELRPDELPEFIGGGARPAEGRTLCLAIANRMEVLADGRACSCKFFPEFIVGDVRESSVAELWHGQRFRELRAAMRQLGLMPICSKCTVLYQNGA